MAKPPPYHNRVTVFVTIQQATKYSPEIEVVTQVQVKDCAPRLVGSLRTVVPKTAGEADLVGMASADVVRTAVSHLLDPEIPTGAGTWPSPYHGGQAF